MLQAEQSFTLRHPAGPQAALAFVREPGRSLSRLDFLRDLYTDGTQVSGVLAVLFPVIGEVTLPFVSQVEVTPDGARLLPRPVPHERAWVEVAGTAKVQEGAEMVFHFDFRAHLTLPDAEGWGGTAFEKMVRAAASRTLTRLAAALPRGLAAAAQSEQGA